MVQAKGIKLIQVIRPLLGIDLVHGKVNRLADFAQRVHCLSIQWIQTAFAVQKKQDDIRL